MMRTIRSLLPIAATMLVVAAPNSAIAAPGGPLAYRSDTRMVPPQSHEGVIALCPKGSALTGGGGRVLPATPQWGLTEADPVESLGPDLLPRDAFRASVANPGPESRRVGTTAICLRRNVSRLHASTETTVLAADQVAGAAFIGCPDGQDAVGGGGAIEGPFEGSTSLVGSGPFGADDGDPALDGWAVAARRQLDGAERSLRVHVRCLDTGVRTVRFRQREATLGAGESRTLMLRCRRPRLHVSGGGVIGNFSIFTSMPVDGRDRDRVPDDGWRVRITNRTLNPQPATAHAICLR